MDLQTTIPFSTLDWIIFASLFVGSFIIGIFHACKTKKSTNDYLMGNRQMGILPVTASLMASHFSAVYVLGIATEVYYYGGYFILSVIEGFFAAAATAYIYLPVYYEIRCTSIYEYLEMRFNKTVQLIATVAFQFQTIILVAFVIYAPALIASQACGLEVWICVLLMGIICTFYTSLGGIKAVMWTDTLQSVFMLASIFAVIILGFIEVGGFNYVWQKNVEHNKLNIFNFDMNPTIRYTVWTIIFGNGMHNVTKFTTQTYVQRYLSTASLKSARCTVWLNYLACTIFVVTTTFAGLILYAAFWDCDPFSTKKISTKDQILPFFVFQRIGAKYPGIPGLFAAGVLSCAISTLSSAINSLATVAFKQFLQPYCTKPIFQNNSVFFVKALSVFYGVLAMAIVPIIEKTGGIFIALMSFVASASGPTFGVVTLGMLYQRTSSKSALIASLFGVAIPVWFIAGNFIYKPIVTTPLIATSGCNMTSSIQQLNYNQSSYELILRKSDDILSVYKISYLWYKFISVMITIVVGVLISFIFDKNNAVDPKLISPIVHKISLFYKNRKLSESKSPNVSVMTGTDINLNIEYKKVPQTITSQSEENI